MQTVQEVALRGAVVKAQAQRMSDATDDDATTAETIMAAGLLAAVSAEALAIPQDEFLRIMGIAWRLAHNDVVEGEHV